MTDYRLKLEKMVVRIAQFLPENLKRPLRRMRRFLKYIPNLGISRYCPVCRIPSRRFAEFGRIPRQDAKCPYCLSAERHRLVWLYFEKMTDLFSGSPKTMLHVAPEPMFEVRLRKKLGSSNYLTADSHDSLAMVRMDIADIPYPDETFDVIYCSHVLEHVQEDRRALSELYRVLKADGWAILAVPIMTENRTFEDPSVTDPAVRLEVFGQEDHVRRCGPDYVERIKKVGFRAEVIAPSRFLSARQISRMAIIKDEGIFCCVKNRGVRPPVE